RSKRDWSSDVCSSDLGWSKLYEFGLYVGNSEMKNGAFVKDVRALSADDYQLIPQVGIGHTNGSGHGAIAREVHDCGNVRLSGAEIGRASCRERVWVVV